ncbi:MAG: PTS fructose transporter subunit IIC [Brevinema sp.]
MSIKIAAVTSCPTGIAHTYMAAENLKKSAQKLGIEIEVETQGSDGVGTPLSLEFINSADYILIAADKVVEKSRFTGKKIIEVPVGEAVKHPEELLKKVIEGKISQTSNEENTGDLFQLNTRTGIYKHLMNGIANMLPFIIGGGILIGISFSFGIFAGDPNHETYNPIAGFLGMWGGGTGAFGLIITVLAGYIAYSVGGQNALMPGMVAGMIADKGRTGFIGGIIAGFIAGYVINFLKKLLKDIPQNIASLKPVLFYPVLGLVLTGLVLTPLLTPIAWIMESLINFLNGLDPTNRSFIGALIGAMMASDLGGPINKTAALFANGAFASGNAYFMSAMMAGGMVPPIALALCTTLFPKLWSDAEKKAGNACYFMGACFITEGVIPFAVGDPIRVLSSCIVGSMVAGTLTQIFNISLPAPHGGIFVIPLASNPLLFILSILIGAVVSALLLAFLKSTSRSY